MIDHECLLSSYIIAYTLISKYPQVNIIIVEKNGNMTYPWCGINTFNYDHHELFDIRGIIPISSFILDGNSINLKINQLNRLGIIYQPNDVMSSLRVFLINTNKTEFVYSVPIYSEPTIFLNFKYPRINTNNIILANLSPTNLNLSLIWLPKFYRKNDYQVEYTKSNYITLTTCFPYESINCQLNLVHNIKLSQIIVNLIRSMSSRM